MKKYLFLFFIQFAFFASFSQETKREVLVIGKITDESDNPLSGANIISLQNRKGTTADKSGLFKIYVISPDSLQISYIGFKTLKSPIPYIPPDVGKDTILFVSFSLETATTGLKELTVSANSKPQLVFGFDGKIRQWIYDYELQDDKIWMLMSKDSKKSLTIINNTGDTLFRHRPLFKAEKFYKDCYGSIFILSEAKAHLASFDKKRFMVRREISLYDFHKNVIPVIAGEKNSVFFREENTATGNLKFSKFRIPGGKEEIFYQYSGENLVKVLEEENRKIQVINAFEEELKEGFISSNQEKVNLLEKSFKEPLTEKKDYTMFDMKVIRDRREMRESYLDFPAPFQLPSNQNSEVNNWFLLQMLKPVFCPFIISNDSVFIFNHIADSILVFSLKGERLFSSYITYRQNGVSGEDILLDEKKGIFYYTFLKKGTVHLQEINIESGNIVRDFKIEDMKFPEKVQVKGGYVYFLHKDKNEKGKRLYKVLIN